MPSLLSKEDFIAQVIDQIDENQDVLYENYRKAQVNPFPMSSKPLNAKATAVEHHNVMMQTTLDKIAKLEKSMGYESLLMNVGGAIVNIAVAYVGLKK